MTCGRTRLLVYKDLIVCPLPRIVFLAVQQSKAKQVFKPPITSNYFSHYLSPLTTRTMATTYAAYRNIYASQSSSRNASTVSTNSNKSASSKTQKVMNFLAPRMPLHEPLTPTSVANQEQQRQRPQLFHTMHQETGSRPDQS